MDRSSHRMSRFTTNSSRLNNLQKISEKNMWKRKVRRGLGIIYSKQLEDKTGEDYEASPERITIYDALVRRRPISLPAVHRLATPKAKRGLQSSRAIEGDRPRYLHLMGIRPYSRLTARLFLSSFATIDVFRLLSGGRRCWRWERMTRQCRTSTTRPSLTTKKICTRWCVFLWFGDGGRDAK